MIRRSFIQYTVVFCAAALLLAACGLKRHPYGNPITKQTQQPDKVLFDRAVNDIEHSRYEIARLTLNTLINTYDTSEYLAKAKLAIADSWYREGGAHGFAEAEAEYKDFILFYPQMAEAAEAQQRVCDIHFKQMDKPDRDPTQARRAEDECRQLVVQFPNSKFVSQAQQRLREIQEVLAQGDFQVGMMYHKKGSFPAAANRLQGVADQFPLYSQADEALWNAADAYRQMGDRFENREAADYARIVKDYPLSSRADDAKAKLEAMDRPVPAPDPVAYARMQYELQNRKKGSIVSRVIGPLSQHPDVTTAAKTGAPNMEAFKPTVPLSVPPPGGGAPGTNTVGAEVSATVVNDTSALDKNPDARAKPPGPDAASAAATPASADPAAAIVSAERANAAAQQLPTNHSVKKAKKQKKNKQQPAPPDASATSVVTPAPAAPAPATPPQQ